jgi:hypothetical protein
MESKLPMIYASEITKYKGRESLMDERISLLDCRWNDVVHSSPIYPNKIFKALLSAGVNNLMPSKWIKIPISKLDEKYTVIYKYENVDGDITPEQFIPFSKESYCELEVLPKETMEWYKNCVKTNRNPLLFHKVPHVLSLNPIDISDCEVICWSI